MRLCVCGHEEQWHEHYRNGTDCAALIPVGTTLYEMVWGSCECPEFKRMKRRRKVKTS